MFCCQNLVCDRQSLSTYALPFIIIINATLN